MTPEMLDVWGRVQALHPIAVMWAAIVGSAVVLAGVLAWDALSDRDPRPLDDRPGSDVQWSEWVTADDLDRMADDREAVEAERRWWL